MAFPHTFEFLREGDRPTVLMLGAGCSFGLIPLPNEILATGRTRAEIEISKITGKEFPKLRVDESAWDALYVWAQQARDELIAAAHHCPKLKIAQVLGLTSEPRWLAGVELPVPQARARHRVMARMAREGILQSIWTFNWDCHVEAALESIGLREQEDVSNQPWTMRYHRVLRLSDYGKLPQDRTIFVHKRHGCIKHLKNLEALEASGSAKKEDFANVQLRITKDELDDTLDKSSPDYKSFRGQIDTDFSGRPLVAIGARLEVMIRWPSSNSTRTLRMVEPTSMIRQRLPKSFARFGLFFHPNTLLKGSALVTIVTARR